MSSHLMTMGSIFALGGIVILANGIIEGSLEDLVIGAALLAAPLIFVYLRDYAPKRASSEDQ